MERFRYGRARPGPDPLAPPLDVNEVLAEVGKSAFGGAGARDGIRMLARRGAPGIKGLDALAERTREVRAREASQAGVDAVLSRARAVLDQALDDERTVLAADPSDEARLRESQLASLPGDPGAALVELGREPYPWRSEQAARAIGKLLSEVRDELIATRLHRASDTSVGTPERAALMADALAELLEARARGEAVDGSAFMAEFADFFPDMPTDLDAIVESLMRSAANARQMTEQLSPTRQAELDALLPQGSTLAAALDRLADALRLHRPDLLDGAAGAGGAAFGTGAAETMAVLADLAELAVLEEALEGAEPEHFGSVDRRALARWLGADAAGDMDRMAEAVGLLRERGHVSGPLRRPHLTPKGVRRLGEAALRGLRPGRLAARGGTHRGPAGDGGGSAAGEGPAVPWHPDSDAPIDAVATVRAALLRSRADGGTPLTLAEQDLRTVHEDARSAAAVCLLVDMSHSMVRSGLLGPAREAALALYTMAEAHHPLDPVCVVGFDSHARELRPDELTGALRGRVQGSNMHHALRLAAAHLDRHPGLAKAVVAVTDGEPTAHTRSDGSAAFAWPASAETAAATTAGLDGLRARGTALTVIAPGDGPLGGFTDAVTERGGTVHHLGPAPIGPALLSAYAHLRHRGPRT